MTRCRPTRRGGPPSLRGSLPSVLSGPLCGLLLLLIAGCGRDDPDGPGGWGGRGPTPGPLVSIGGALSSENEAVFRAILDRRAGNGPLCIIPTASADPEDSGALAVARFERYAGAGVAAVVHLTVDAPERAHEAEVAAELSGCSGYFFVGGQQSRITRVLGTAAEPTPALQAILRRYSQGAVVSGSSAGAAMMSEPMIAGGTSAAALRNGATRGGGGPSGVQLQGGLGLIDGVILDQHFLARGRIGRLVVAVLDPTTPDRGIGVDENTAVVVENGLARVVGASGIVVVDVSEARPSAGGPGGEGILVHLLGDGDVYDFRTREVIPEPGKRLLPVDPSRVEPPSDLFDRWAFLSLVVAFARSGDERVDILGDGYRAIIVKAPGFRATARPEGGEAGSFGGGGDPDEGVEEGGSGPGPIPPGFGAGPFLVELVAVRGGSGGG